MGEGARDRGGKGNANVGDGGVAFVLSSSGPSPGGSETVGRTSCSLTCLACIPSGYRCVHSLTVAMQAQLPGSKLSTCVSHACTQGVCIE